MLNSEKKFRTFRDKTQNLTLVLSEKNLSERKKKTHSPLPPPAS